MMVRRTTAPDDLRSGVASTALNHAQGLLSSEWVIVPCNEENVHWGLFVLNPRVGKYLYFDPYRPNSVAFDNLSVASRRNCTEVARCGGDDVVYLLLSKQRCYH